MGSLLLIGVALFAGLTGNVRDAVTGEPVEGARVEVSTAAQAVFTDEEGWFDIPTGHLIQIRVIAEGYEEKVRTITPEEATPVVIELFPSNFDLDELVVTAARGGSDNRLPVASVALEQSTIEKTYAGEEVPEVLGATPSVTTFSDAGIPLGYTYMRLRGLDHSRINMTIDGIPLNELEDQGVYFSNFPDFMNSVESVTVQRGVGTSMFGTAAYVGSVHFETPSLPVANGNTEINLSAGSYETGRGSVEASTGLLESRVAAYGRISGHTTDGYREHSGSDSRSYLFKTGYFGNKDQVQILTFGGKSNNDMVYLATARPILEEDRRANYLSEREKDEFSQHLLALTYARAINKNLTWNTKLYRNDLQGHYGVLIDGLWDFNVKSDWLGAISYLHFVDDFTEVAAGINLNAYERAHWLLTEVDEAPREQWDESYRNSGEKGERAAFVRVTRAMGDVLVMGDVQWRQTDFQYVPDEDYDFSGVDERQAFNREWTFLNPRLGLNWNVAEGLALYGFYGRNTREPTRNDMFGGFDDLSPYELDFIGSIHDVRAERVSDYEAGAKWSQASAQRDVVWSGSANFFWMDFKNEITPVGELSYIGLPLRKNVDESYRRGVEVEVSGSTLREESKLDFGGNITYMDANIEEYTDDATGLTYRDVEPLLTPEIMGGLWGTKRWGGNVRTGLQGRFVGESYLDNTEDDRFVLPSYGLLNGHVAYAGDWGEVALHLRNLTSADVYSSGYVDTLEDTETGELKPVSAYFPVAPLNFMVNVKLNF